MFYGNSWAASGEGPLWSRWGRGCCKCSNYGTLCALPGSKRPLPLCTEPPPPRDHRAAPAKVVTLLPAQQEGPAAVTARLSRERASGRGGAGPAGDQRPLQGTRRPWEQEDRPSLLILWVFCRLQAGGVGRGFVGLWPRAGTAASPGCRPPTRLESPWLPRSSESPCELGWSCERVGGRPLLRDTCWLGRPLAWAHRCHHVCCSGSPASL